MNALWQRKVSMLSTAKNRLPDRVWGRVWCQVRGNVPARRRDRIWVLVWDRILARNPDKGGFFH